jgi:hypothetical protein
MAAENPFTSRLYRKTTSPPPERTWVIAASCERRAARDASIWPPRESVRLARIRSLTEGARITTK